MPKRVPIHRPPGVASEAQRKRSYERRSSRREDIAFYQGLPWRRLRGEYLAAHPLCERCEAADRVVAATHLHHKVERKEQPALALVWSNLEALCNPCHSAHHGFKVGRDAAR